MTNTSYAGFRRLLKTDLGADAGVHLAYTYDDATGRLSKTYAGPGRWC